MFRLVKATSLSYISYSETTAVPSLSAALPCLLAPLLLFNAVLSSEVGVAIEFDFLDRFQGRFAKFRATLQNLLVEVAAFLVHSSDGDLHIIIEFGRTNLMTILMRIRKRRCMKIIAKIPRFLEKYTPFLP